MKIFGWAADQAGCGYYRMGLPLTHLMAQGLADTQVSTQLDLSQDWDVIVGQRVSGESQSKIWKGLTEREVLAVYELDDDLFQVPESNPAFEFYSDPAMQAQISSNLACSDLVTVSTEPLARVVKEHTDAPVVVLPNCVDSYMFPSAVDQSVTGSIGWAGSSTHYGDLAPVASFLRRAADRTDSAFISVGADYTGLVKAKQTAYSGWEPNIPDYYKLLDFGIGVAPLEDNTFNQSKSALKALEYGARGIVTVASNVGPYASFIEHETTGLLVNSDHEWEKYIRCLSNDLELRQTLAANAFEQSKQYDINYRAIDWLLAYTSKGI